MTTNVETDITVQRFGYAADPNGKRLAFPRVEMHDTQGKSGTVAYGAADVLFDGLEGRLDTLRWSADSMSVGGAWLRDDAGRFDIAVQRIEMPREVRLVRADRGVELVSPHVSLHEMKLLVKGPFGRTSDGVGDDPRTGRPTDAAGSIVRSTSLRSAGNKPVEPAGPPKLRQDGLRFLDSLTGRIYLTVKVVLDLPVLGHRTLDQDLRVPVQEGAIDFRALDNGLDWLEGAFLDIEHVHSEDARNDGRLAITWRVPIFGSSRDLISWSLDDDAQKLASFGRVPVRSLVDVRVGSGEKPAKPSKKNILQALSFQAIDIALNLVAPRSFEVGNGLIMFGGEGQPGLVDFAVTGAINANRPGGLVGKIGSIDTTIKDLRIGPLTLTADRFHLDGLDELEVAFDGFKPTQIKVVIHRVTATNLSLQIA